MMKAWELEEAICGMGGLGAEVPWSYNQGGQLMIQKQGEDSYLEVEPTAAPGAKPPAKPVVFIPRPGTVTKTPPPSYPTITVTPCSLDLSLLVEASKAVRSGNLATMNAVSNKLINEDYRLNALRRAMRMGSPEATQCDRLQQRLHAANQVLLEKMRSFPTTKIGPAAIEESAVLAARGVVPAEALQKQQSEDRLKALEFERQRLIQEDEAKRKAYAERQAEFESSQKLLETAQPALERVTEALERLKTSREEEQTAGREYEAGLVAESMATGQPVKSVREARNLEQQMVAWKARAPYVKAAVDEAVGKAKNLVGGVWDRFAAAVVGTAEKAKVVVEAKELMPAAGTPRAMVVPESELYAMFPETAPRAEVGSLKPVPEVRTEQKPDPVTGNIPRNADILLKTTPGGAAWLSVDRLPDSYQVAIKGGIDLVRSTFDELENYVRTPEMDFSVEIPADATDARDLTPREWKEFQKRTAFAQRLQTALAIQEVSGGGIGDKIRSFLADLSGDDKKKTDDIGIETAKRLTKYEIEGSDLTAALPPLISEAVSARTPKERFDAATELLKRRRELPSKIEGAVADLVGNLAPIGQALQPTTVLGIEVASPSVTAAVNAALSVEAVPAKNRFDTLRARNAELERNVDNLKARAVGPAAEDPAIWDQIDQWKSEQKKILKEAEEIYAYPDRQIPRVIKDQGIADAAGQADKASEIFRQFRGGWDVSWLKNVKQPFDQGYAAAAAQARAKPGSVPPRVPGVKAKPPQVAQKGGSLWPF